MILPAGFAPEGVLLVRPRGLGDVVLSTAVIEAVRRAYPGARVDYLAEAPARSLLEEDTRLDRLFLLSRTTARGARVEAGSTARAVGWIRGGRYDLVLDLFSNPRTALLTALSGARYRAGLAKRLRQFSYNIRIPRFGDPPRRERRYARDAMLDFVRAAGVSWEGSVEAGIALTGADRRFAAEALTKRGYQEGQPFGAVLPGGSWASKRWSVDGFATAAERLAERLGGPTLVLWGPPEAAEAEAIAERLGDRGRLAPSSSLREMAALLARATTLVSTDCLGRHLAIVQGVSTVGVFGSTNPLDWTPREGPHRWVRCPSDSAGGALCDLAPAPVLREIDALLEALPLDSVANGT